MLSYDEAADAPPGSSGKLNHRDFEVMIVNDDFRGGADRAELER